MRNVMHAAALAAALGSIAATAGAATLYTTQGDFSNWSNGTNFTTTGVVTGSTDSSSTNGAGNTATSPGSAGTSGSLQVVRGASAGNYSYFYGPGEQSNATFFNALGSSLTGSNITASTGTFSFDTSTTPVGTGSYFQLGVVLNYDGHFDQIFGSTVDNGNGTSTTSIPYSISAASLSYFQFGLIYNSDYNPSTFIIDNIRTDKVLPEPATLSLLSLGGLIGLKRRR